MTISNAAQETKSSPWVEAHEALSRLAKARALADAEEGRWLLAAMRTAVHVHLGFGSFGEYVERLFGYGRRCTQEKLRVAEMLEGLPVLARALEAGALNWSAVRELTRVAVRETEGAWLEVARGKSVRQLEELVAGKRVGDSPESPSDPTASHHVLRFEVEADTFALFRQAVAELRRGSDSALTDDAVLLEMARRVLGGPLDQGRASYQIAVIVCGACGRASQDANGEVVAVGPEIVAMASCDGQHIGSLSARPANDGSPRVGTPMRAHVGARAKQNVPPAVPRAVLRRDGGCCRVPGCRNATFVDVHHIELRSEGGAHALDNLVTVCGAHHRALHRGELSVEGDMASGVCFRHADGTRYGEVGEPRAVEMAAKLFGALRNLGFCEKEVRRVLAELGQVEELRQARGEVWLRWALQRLTRPAVEYVMR